MKSTRKAKTEAIGKAKKTNAKAASVPPVAAVTNPQPLGGRLGRRPKNKAADPLPPIAHIGIDAPAREGPGRPTDYRPEYAKVAGAMARLGGTDFDIAEELGVMTSTIWRWRSKHPEFCSALLEGKDAFDDRIERSLAMKAAGYSYHSQKVFNYEGCVVRADIVEHIPPDVGAIKLWLGNRRPDKWKDKQEIKMDGSDAFLKLWQAISDGTATKEIEN